jgi:CheY-like chemotaxis protein
LSKNLPSSTSRKRIQYNSPFFIYRISYPKDFGRQINFEGVKGDRKQVLVIDDDYDSAFTIKSFLESHFRQDTEGLEFHPIQVTVYVDPLLALKEFKTYYYDLLLVDINMPSINGYELVEKIIKLDLNIKICLMSAGEINYEVIREIRHPSKSFGCFIKKLLVLIWSIECCGNYTRGSTQPISPAQTRVTERENASSILRANPRI